jgi:hypothetical protein
VRGDSVPAGLALRPLPHITIKGLGRDRLISFDEARKFLWSLGPDSLAASRSAPADEFLKLLSVGLASADLGNARYTLMSNSMTWPAAAAIALSGLRVRNTISRMASFSA